MFCSVISRILKWRGIDKRRKNLPKSLKPPAARSELFLPWKIILQSRKHATVDELFFMCRNIPLLKKYSAMRNILQ
jgi:hypothetical protein